MIALSVLQYHARTHSACILSKERPACKMLLPLKALLNAQFLSLCILWKRLPCFSRWLPIAQLLILACRPPSFCPVSCWLHLYSQVIITSAQAATAALRYVTFPLQTFGPLLWPVLTGLDFFTGLLPKIWEQVHSFSARYSSDWVFTWKYDVASQYTKQGYKSNTNNYS